MYAVKIFTLYPEIFPGPLAGGNIWKSHEQMVYGV